MAHRPSGRHLTPRPASDSHRVGAFLGTFAETSEAPARRCGEQNQRQCVETVGINIAAGRRTSGGSPFRVGRGSSRLRGAHLTRSAARARQPPRRAGERLQPPRNRPLWGRTTGGSSGEMGEAWRIVPASTASERARGPRCARQPGHSRAGPTAGGGEPDSAVALDPLGTAVGSGRRVFPGRGSSGSPLRGRRNPGSAGRPGNRAPRRKTVAPRSIIAGQNAALPGRRIAGPFRGFSAGAAARAWRRGSRGGHGVDESHRAEGDRGDGRGAI